MTHAIGRRGFLGFTALALTVPVVQAAHVTTLAGAWNDEQGRSWLGLLRAADGRPLQVLHQLELPTRAHGLCVDADGSVLAAARRPGPWLLRWRPGAAQAPRWLWLPPERCLCGHVVQATDGHWLCTEADTDDGSGLVVRRHRQTLETLAEWPTGGIDPHQLLLDADGTLLVANGGVPTAAETGRVKLSRQGMVSSLVRLHAGRGERLGQWRLTDERLSIRHLARHASGVLGIALQAEHDGEAEREQAPLLALFDGRGLWLPPGQQAMAGYAGDIAATTQGFVLSATRAGRLLPFSTEGRALPPQPLPEAGALARGRDGRLWAGGRGQAQVLGATAAGGWSSHTSGALRLDNHWRVV